MKKALFGSMVTLAIAVTPAFAADMTPAYKAAPMAPPVAIYNWTGFYIGGHIGGGWAENESIQLAPGSVSFPTGTAFTKNNLSGFLGGVQGGFNWQASNNFVLGVEGEYSWADLNGTASTVSVVNGFVTTATAKINDLALATGRLGYAANNWLFYVKGGGAWGQASTNGTGVLANGTPFNTTSSSTNRSGWVVGGGVEWGFAPNWSAKIEYDHIDFGSSTVAINTTPGTTNFISTSQTVDLVKGGINYRFNWGGPVVATY
jgi:outer membrane immunogenic protein